MRCLSLFLICGFMLRAHAGYLYCLEESAKELSINSESGPVNYLVFHSNDSEPSSDNDFTCKWVFSFDFSRDVLLLLRGFDTAVEDLSLLQRQIRSADLSGLNAARIRYKLLDDSTCSVQTAGSWETVELRTFRALQLSGKAKLTVKLRLKGSYSRSRPNEIPGLRIQLMEPGFCCEDTVNFDHNCFTTTATRRSLKDELAAMCRGGGVAQLASFNSSSVLQRFVLQSQKTRVGFGLKIRSNRPLNLKQPVRIGLFYDSWTGSIFYLSETGGQFGIKLFTDTQQLYYNVQATSSRVSCGSLKLAQTANGATVSFGVVDFRDCNESLPALLRFPDSARNCCCNCSAREVLIWLDSATTDTTPRPAKVTPVPEMEKDGANHDGPECEDKEKSESNCSVYFVLFFIMLFTLFAWILGSFACGCCNRWRSKEGPRSSSFTSTHGNLVYGRENPAASQNSLLYLHKDTVNNCSK